MSERWGRHVRGLLAGLLVTYGVMMLSREAVADFLRSVGRGDAASHRWAALLLVVLGAAVAGVAILVARLGPLVAAVPAVLLLLVYSPLLFLHFPGWYPDGLARFVLESYNVHVPLIAGVFAGAAAWEAAKQRPSAANKSSPEPGSDSHVPTGA